MLLPSPLKSNQIEDDLEFQWLLASLAHLSGQRKFSKVTSHKLPRKSSWTKSENCPIKAQPERHYPQTGYFSGPGERSSVRDPETSDER